MIDENSDKVLSNSGKLSCRVITKVVNIESNDYNKDIILWGNDLLPYVFVLGINSRNSVGEIYVNELNNIFIFSETLANSENKEYIHERDIESGNWSKFYTWDESGSLIWCLVTSQYVIYKYATGNEYYIKYDNQVKMLPHEFIDVGLSEYSTISLKDITGDGIEELFYWPCKDCALKPILILDPVECKDISYFRFVIEDSPVRRLYLKSEYIEEIKNIIEEHPEINQEFADLIETHSVEQELDGWRLYGTSNSRDVFFIKYVKENLSLEVYFEYLGDGFYITSLVYNDDVIGDMIINLKTK